MNIKKGYKRINLDMTSKYANFKYDINIPYYVEGELKICKKGFHLCDNMLDTSNFYNSKKSRLFEVEYNLNNCIKDENKICSNYIKLIREISEKEYRDYIKEYVKNNDITNKKPWERYEIARYGYCLDVFIYDEDSWVRQEVAKQGYGLNVLIHDEDFEVRDTAKQKLNELNNK